jgi:hypothetical protein
VLEPSQKAPPRKKRRFGRPTHALRLSNLALPGLDLRSQEGKRYAAVVAELVAEYGNTDLTRIKELAALRISLEKVQVEAMRGSVKAREDVVRFANLLTRRENELHARAKPKAADAAPSIADIAARERNGGAHA